MHDKDMKTVTTLDRDDYEGVQITLGRAIKWIMKTTRKDDLKQLAQADEIVADLVTSARFLRENTTLTGEDDQ